MAVITLSQPGDVLSTALDNIAHGTVQSHNSTSFVVKNPDTDDTTLDDDDILAAITGTNFGSFDSKGIPHSGTITQIQTQDFMFHPLGTISGLSLSVTDFLNFVSTNNEAGLEAAIFSGDDTFSGSTGADNFSGLDGNDTFNLMQGGNDIVSGGNGNDVFIFNAAFTAADQIDGGAGTDTLTLNGDYSAGVTLAANTMANVETISFTAGHNYKLTTNDANVAAGQTLTVDGSALGATDVLTFNGAAETDGNFSLTGGAGNDALTGGAGSDTFNLMGGGNDIASGGNGNDTFSFGAAFVATDQVDGGAGTDTISLNGDYSAGVTFAANTLVNVESISLAAGHSYKLTINDANVASGQMLTVDGSALGAADVLTFNGATETNGSFTLLGGAGNDAFTGGAGNDVLTGGAGNDSFNLLSGGNDVASGGDGNDTFSLGPTFTAADQIDGGTGTDTVTLGGDYSAGITLAANTMVNVETLSFVAGHNYTLTTNDANIASGQTLTVNGGTLGAANVLTFNGAAETNGKFAITGGAGNDVLTGGAGADFFTLTSGGNDIANGGNGNDTFSFGATFTAADQVDGGAGTDTLTLNGDYSAGVTLATSTMVNVETISFLTGHNYALTTNDANVAAGQTLTVNAGALGAANTLTFNGAAETDGKFAITGGAGNDVLTGGAGADFFTLTSGGNDVVNGSDGNDTFSLGAAFTAADQIDGGGGTDVLTLNGDYSTGRLFTASTMVNVESISFAAGHSYKLTTNDATVAAGQTLIVNGSALGVSDVLTFNGSAELDGKFSFTGGAGNDVLTGGWGADFFALSGGGNDIANGGNGVGNDTFNFGAAFTASDQVNGGAGTDTLTLNGDYSAGVTLAANTMVGVETIGLSAGHSYKLTTDDANVASGQTLTVNGSTLGAADALTFNGAAETNGKFVLTGGAGNDVLTGGAGNDQINGGAGSNILTGGGGVDTITGGAGADTFVYSAVSDSTGSSHDVIKNFDAVADKFDLPFSVTGVDAAIASGTLNTGQFNANLASAVDATHLAAGHAVLFTATLGTLSGHTFLVVDANGIAGYQANADFVFEVTGAANLASLGTADFI